MAKRPVHDSSTAPTTATPVAGEGRWAVGPHIFLLCRNRHFITAVMSQEQGVLHLE